MDVKRSFNKPERMINPLTNPSLLRRVEASAGAHEPVPTEQELHILKAALHCFAIRGFAATTVRAIAAEAGVTGPMINYYFQSKDQLYRRIVQIVSDDMQARFGEAAAVPGSLRERLRRVMHAYVDFATDSPDAVGLFFGAAYGPPEGRPDLDAGAIREIGQIALRQLIFEAVESRAFVLRPGYEAADLLELCTGAFVHVIGREFSSGWRPDAERGARMKTELDRSILVVLDGIEASQEGAG